jgi:hypothetical protein
MPALTRAPLDPYAARFVKVFALVPVLLATIFAVVLGRPLPIGGAAPAIVLSGLAAVLAAGQSIELYHQRILGFAWAGLLLLPALLVPAVLILLPWTLGTDLRVAQPAAAMGRFFAESFQQRTGRPLKVITGDVNLAAIAALGAPGRPSVYFLADPNRSPSVTPGDIRKNGAVVVWLTPDTTPTPPPQIKASFPDLIPEVPQAFRRRIEGRLPVFRIGWGVIRPARVSASAAAH